VGGEGGPQIGSNEQVSGGIQQQLPTFFIDIMDQISHHPHTTEPGFYTLVFSFDQFPPPNHEMFMRILYTGCIFILFSVYPRIVYTESR